MTRPLRSGALALAAPFAFASAAFAPAGLAAEETAAQAAVSDIRALEVAREIIAIGMPEETRETVFAATMDQMMVQMREAQKQSGMIGEDPAIEAIVEANLAEFREDAMGALRARLPELMEGWALAYASIFSHEDLVAIREFVRTPAGQRFFQLSPAVTAEPNFAAANQLYMNDVMAMLPQLQRNLEADLTEYLEAQAAEPEAN
ncbi:DUF2059 domain-containing protein [Erythrobacter sp. HL-111]|uniref:DUF2059 domain-containing protein n=1 Tax=Erythrobacter sp. HL-111 TaxID=1798193 RepID=UPI0006DA63A8|nr:DUF2059 domain-containing protein [Erythrobacter sp. HL-111]KPP93240.1 MAG: putative protein conserved in bacteria (DUF2059) [Erythrobacteraceae bacterium HL-111]SDR90485.1 hypothetical protein SAMN04515621_0603 [Erythrobacter sp. HL-111]